MGWLIAVCCLILTIFGWSTLREGWRKRYAGFIVSGLVSFGFAAGSVWLESWGLAVGGLVALLVQPFVIPAVFGKPPETAGPLRYTDPESGRKYRVVEDETTGEARREYFDG